MKKVTIKYNNLSSIIKLSTNNIIHKEWLKSKKWNIIIFFFKNKISKLNLWWWKESTLICFTCFWHKSYKERNVIFWSDIVVSILQGRQFFIQCSEWQNPLDLCILYTTILIWKKKIFSYICCWNSWRIKYTPCRDCDVIFLTFKSTSTQ
jgi:hypothetical protein